jgi:hypothetical protein
VRHKLCVGFQVKSPAFAPDNTNVRDTAQAISLPPLRLQRARDQLWNDLTDSDRQAAHQVYTALMSAIAEPGALLPIESLPRTRLLEVLFRGVTVVRALRWGLYPALVCAGLMVQPWFLAGAPLVFLLDRAIFGYYQIRLAVDLAARVQVFSDLTLEGIEPLPPEPPWPEAEPFPPLDR